MFFFNKADEGLPGEENFFVCFYRRQWGNETIAQRDKYNATVKNTQSN